MTAELQQLADQLAPDYDATKAMQDLQMMAQMVRVGRDELALTCVNRVNAYLWKLDNAGKELIAETNAQNDRSEMTWLTTDEWSCCEHCVNWDTPDDRPHQHPTPCGYITNLETGDPPTTCQNANAE